MLALLGMLSLLQMCLLPGLVVLYCLGIRRLFQVLLLAMPVSLTANYGLFHLLNAMGYRNQRSWLILIGVEVLVLLVIAWRHRRTTVRELVQPDLARLERWVGENLIANRESRSFNAVLLAMGLAVFVCFIALAFYRPGLTTFTQGDDALTWGGWAKEWAEHGAATQMYWYPQLGPINRAVGYLILGTTDIHLFNKMAMPLFPLLIVALLLDIELHYRDTRYLLSAAIAGGLYWCFRQAGYGDTYLTSGLMDIPTALMILAAIYPLLVLGRASGAHAPRMAVVSAIVAAGAAWTKQTGLFVIPAVVVMWWWQRRERDARLQVTTMCMVIATAVLAAASYYLPQALRINRGGDVSNLAILRSLTWRDPWLHNDLLGAVCQFPLLASLVICGAGLSAVGGRYRQFSVPLVLLSFAIWGSLFNYEIRNYFFALPYLALALADGCLYVWGYLRNAVVAFLRGCLIWFRGASASAVVLLPALITMVVLLRAPDSVVVNRQRNANRELSFGIPTGVLLDVAAFIDPEAKIGTCHMPSIGIPEAHGRFVMAGYWGETKSSYLKAITAPNCRFVFVEPSLLKPDLVELIENARQRGLLRQVMKRNNATLYHYDPAEMRAEYGHGGGD